MANRGSTAPLPAQAAMRNLLLAALRPAELDRLAPYLEWVPMPLGQILYGPGSRLRHAYFPTTSIVSLLYTTESGATAEFAGVGYEGVVGVPLFMGGGTTSSSAVVRNAGHACRLEGRRLMAEFDRGGHFTRLLLAYTQGLMVQIAQRTACNRRHSAEQQLCCLLLTTLDRLRDRDLVMTQEVLAGVLGVRRETIAGAAAHLQSAGVIKCQRRHVAVLDRAGLEQRACECYGIVKREQSRVLAGVGIATPAAPRFAGQAESLVI